LHAPGGEFGCNHHQDDHEQQNEHTAGAVRGQRFIRRVHGFFLDRGGISEMIIQKYWISDTMIVPIHYDLNVTRIPQYFTDKVKNDEPTAKSFILTALILLMAGLTACRPADDVPYESQRQVCAVHLCHHQRHDV
jgi:hypothetical protein